MIKPTAAQLKEFDFSKIKIDADSHVTLSYERMLPEGKTTIDGETPDGIAHQTFVDAFQELKIHAAIYSEYLDMDAKKYKSLETAQTTSKETEKFRIGTVNFGSTKIGGDYIIISYTRQMKIGSPTNNNTGRLFLSSEDKETSYPYLDELNKTLKFIKHKAVAYVFGEYAAEAQGDLFKDKKEQE